MTVKKFLYHGFLLLLVFSLAACGGNANNSGGSSGNAQNDGTATSGSNSSTPQDPPKAAPDKLRVAYHPNMGGSSAIITGIKKGFFAEENLEIELVKFTSGPPEVAAMVSGDIDLGYIGHGAHALAVKGQVHVITLDLLSKSEELLVRKSSGIAKVEDLKGKTVATQLGTSGEVTLNLALKRANMTKDDIKLVNMDMAGAVSAFIADKVDAVVVWAPYTVEIRNELGDEALMLANSLSFSDEFVFPSSWVATPKYLSENEDKVVRFLKALHRAMDYRKEHLDEVVQYVAELNDIPLDSVMQEKETGEWLTGAQVRQYFADGTAKQWYEQQQQLFLDNGAVEQRAPVEDYVRFDLVEKAAN
jgi:NitT/TauT family transport system substrate-binding protein